MGLVSKVMGLASLGSSLANVATLHRLVEGMISVIAFTILSAMMMGMLLMLGFYGLYQCLTGNGLSAEAALFTVILLGCVVTGISVTLAMWRLREFRDLSQRSLSPGVQPMAKMGDMTNAFLQGFRLRRPQ